MFPQIILTFFQAPRARAKLPKFEHLSLAHCPNTHCFLSFALSLIQHHMSDTFCPGLFNIGLICSDGVEGLAARLCLDEELKERQQYHLDRDPNYYSLGKISDHYVVISYLVESDSETRVIDAGICATQMCHSFPEIKILVTLGIGNALAGQIVVSDPLPPILHEYLRSAIISLEDKNEQLHNTVGSVLRRSAEDHQEMFKRPGLRSQSTGQGYEYPFLSAAIKLRL